MADSSPTRAYIGVGSNLEDPRQQVSKALAELDAIDSTRCAVCSSLYASTPMGPADQPDYINAVAGLDTALEPAKLLAELQTIESRHARVRGKQRWGPRTLDLDILLYADQTIDTDDLTIPHPGLHEREFVLYPLAEIVEDIAVPGRGLLSVLLKNCPRGALRRLQ